MAKLTVAEVKSIAMKNYNNGGDAIIECCDDSDIQKLIDEGLTLKSLFSMFNIRNEEFKAAEYFAGCNSDAENEDVDDWGEGVEEEEEEEYHSCGYDYSPSCPWNAPGMSVKDFI